MSDSRLKGKVARILDSRSLVINIGSNHGVEMGMYFDVMDPNGEEIQDPDTKQILGSIERPKVRVRIIDVKDNLSVASTYKKKKINIGGQATSMGVGFDFAKYLMPPKWIDKYETFKTDEKTWEDFDQSQSYVKTGDPVYQVITQIDASEGLDSQEET